MLAALPLLTLYWLDGSGSIGSTRVTIGSNLPVATIEAAAANLAAAASSLTGCVLVRQEISYRFVPESGQLGAIGSDKFRAGVFMFETDTIDEYGLITIPSIKFDKLMSSGPGAGVLINTDDEDVQSFIETCLSAEYVNEFAYQLAQLLAAYRQSRV